MKKVEGFIIYGVPGSAAETYANENGFTFVEVSEPTPEPEPEPTPEPTPTPTPSADSTPAPAVTEAPELVNDAKEVVGGSTVKVTSATSKAVSFVKAKNAKSVTVPATIKLSDGKTYRVTQINANAFKGSKATTVTIGKNVKVIKKNAFKESKATKLILKTKLLKKAKVKGCLKGSKIKTIQVKVGTKKQNQTYVKKYKKFFTKANAGKKVTVK